MPPEFSLAHLTVLDCPPPQMTYIAANAGFDYVSFRPIYMGLPGEPNYDLARNKAMFRDTRNALNETGLKLLDIELAKVDDHTNPKAYEPAMEIAAELEGKHVLSSIWTDDRNLAIERFCEICELADQYGLTVELEYVPIASVKNLAGAVDILKATNQENAGLMIDVHHFHRAHDKVEDLDAVPKEWFRYLHLCDASADIPKTQEEMKRSLREERLFVGEGSIEIATILSHLPDIPYSIELPHLKRTRELGYLAFAKKCLETAKDYFILLSEIKKFRCRD